VTFAYKLFGMESYYGRRNAADALIEQ